MNVGRGGLVAVLWVIAAGCGKVVDSDGDRDASNSDIDGAPGDLADAEPGEFDAALPSAGLVYVFTRNYTQGTDLILTSTVTAEFGDSATEDCTVELAGTTCQVLACTQRDPATTHPTAGNLSIEALGNTTVLAPEKDGSYSRLDVDGVLFSDGGTLSLLAAGGDVPAFEIADLTAPYSIGFQGGVATSAGPIKLTASQDYPLAWGGIEPSDSVRIHLSSERDGEGHRWAVACRVGAGVGGLTIPSEALQLLPTGELLFESRVETRATTTAGSHEVTLVAGVVARLGDDASGDWAAGTVLLGP